MKEFIDKILEIDKQAKDMTLELDDLKAKADRDIESDIEKIKSETAERTKKAIAECEKNEKEKAKTKLNKKKKEYEAILQNFDSVFEQNKKEWIKKIVSEAVK